MLAARKSWPINCTKLHDWEFCSGDELVKTLQVFAVKERRYDPVLLDLDENVHKNKVMEF